MKYPKQRNLTRIGIAMFVGVGALLVIRSLVSAILKRHGDDCFHMVSVFQCFHMMSVFPYSVNVSVFS